MRCSLKQPSGGHLLFPGEVTYGISGSIKEEKLLRGHQLMPPEASIHFSFPVLSYAGHKCFCCCAVS